MRLQPRTLKLANASLTLSSGSKSGGSI
eukprot:COSAG04_NODE_30108_length_264_cov_1.278788_2_plen_27_part_01